MIRRYLKLPFAIVAFAVLTSLHSSASAAEQQPQYETRKLTDNVYIFRYGGAQAMFVMTPDGVIATDPLNAKAAAVYLQEIKKITPAPVRYVVYSHHHLDHISGGAPFKDAGATFVAHRASAPSERPERGHSGSYRGRSGNRSDARRHAARAPLCRSEPQR